MLRVLRTRSSSVQSSACRLEVLLPLPPAVICLMKKASGMMIACRGINWHDASTTHRSDCDVFYCLWGLAV